MLLNTLDDREIETLILALKYWRYHRHGGTRRTDRLLTIEGIDLLLAKLGCSTIAPLPDEDDLTADRPAS
jgi:hypothetical protein